MNAAETLPLGLLRVSAKARTNVLRSRLECLARRTLEIPEVSAHDGPERSPPFRQRGQAVERPRAHERLRNRYILEKHLFDAALLRRTPVEQRQGANDLQTDLPLVAGCEWANEDFLAAAQSSRYGRVPAFPRDR